MLLCGQLIKDHLWRRTDQDLLIGPYNQMVSMQPLDFAPRLSKCHTVLPDDRQHADDSFFVAHVLRSTEILVLRGCPLKITESRL